MYELAPVKAVTEFSRAMNLARNKRWILLFDVYERVGEGGGGTMGNS